MEEPFARARLSVESIRGGQRVMLRSISGVCVRAGHVEPVGAVLRDSLQAISLAKRTSALVVRSQDIASEVSDLSYSDI